MSETRTDREGIDFATDLNNNQVKDVAQYYAMSLQHIVDAFDAEGVKVGELHGLDVFRIEEAAKFLREIHNGKVVF